MSFRYFYILLLTLPLSGLSGQNIKHNIGGSYYARGGNTDYKYYSINYSMEVADSIKLGNLELNDIEFLFAAYHSLSEWNREPYENDAGGILKVDLWANGRFSPFLFAETYYDSTQGLDNRTNIGLGLKYRIIGNILSISYALMYENEKYVGFPKDSFSRHSFRPKIKLNLENGLFVDSQLFFKPTLENMDNYLLEWKNNLSISTGREWLSFTIDYNYKFNSDPGEISYKIIDGERISELYKKKDTTISIGIDISL